MSNMHAARKEILAWVSNDGEIANLVLFQFVTEFSTQNKTVRKPAMMQQYGCSASKKMHHNQEALQKRAAGGMKKMQGDGRERDHSPKR
ncbi:MAG: hypothetical protein ACOY3Z_08095 [Thermodesulfobacteriota bacterium]